MAEKKGLLQEFKDFAVKGNVIDLAVGIIIGAAFKDIITSLVNDIVMPPIGLLLGKVDFSNLFWALDGGDYASLAAAQEAGAPTMNYGVFINTVISFLIIAWVVFVIVKQLNRLKAKPEPATPEETPTTKTCPFCKTEIPLEAVRCPACTSHLEEAK